MKTCWSSSRITLLLIYCCALITLSKGETDFECPEIRGDYFTMLTQDELKLMCLMKHRIDFGGKEEDEESEGESEEERPNLHSATEDELRDLFHVDDSKDELLRQEQLRQAEVQESLLRQRDEDNKLAHNILAQLMTTMRIQQKQQQQEQFYPQQPSLPWNREEEKPAAFGEDDIVLDYYRF